MPLKEGFTLSSELFESAAATLEKGVAPASKFFNYIACAALCVMPIPVFVNVLLRHTFSYSIPGDIELQEFLMLFLVFFGLASVQQDGGGHIRIDLVVRKLKGRVRTAVETFTYLMSFLITLLISSQLVNQGIKKFQNGEISKSLELPISVFW